MSELLFERLASRCWYCGQKLVRNARWLRSNNISSPVKGRPATEEYIEIEKVDTPRAIVRDKLFPETPEFGVISCRGCASRRHGKKLEAYRAWLAEKQQLSAPEDYLFYVERVFAGLEG